MDKINVITVVSKNNKTTVVFDDKVLDMKDIISMDIHIEYGCLTVTTTKVETLKLGD